jgi:hypothetical protein
VISWPERKTLLAIARRTGTSALESLPSTTFQPVPELLDHFRKRISGIRVAEGTGSPDNLPGLRFHQIAACPASFLNHCHSLAPSAGISKGIMQPFIAGRQESRCRSFMPLPTALCRLDLDASPPIFKDREQAHRTEPVCGTVLACFAYSFAAGNFAGRPAS